MTTGRTCTHAPVILGLLGLTLCLSAAPAEGQSPNTGTFVAVPERFPDIEASALIVREPGRDIVLLNPASLAPDALEAAFSALRSARVRSPHPRTGELIPVVGFAFRKGLDRARAEVLERALRRLRARPLSTIGSFGPGRWIRFGPQ